MNDLIKLLKQFFIAEIGPAVITLLFLGFTFFYWGPGLLLIGFAFLMIPICGIGALILNAIFRKRQIFQRIIITSMFTLLIGISLQSWQFLNSTPNKLKVGFLTPSLEDKFDATRGKLEYIGLEHEIYVELHSTPELTQELLDSRAFEEIEIDDDYRFPSGPDWFPHEIKPHYTIYEFTNYELEQKYTAIISSDKKVIYGFFLGF